MNDDKAWFAGIDWASQEHEVRLIDATGKDRGGRRFKHGGAGLNAMAEWLMAKSGACASAIHVAIETPHGPVVEGMLARGFNLYAINPRQLDRFRDRYTMAGAKDDSRDALVLASALRSDAACLRKLEVEAAVVVELREVSRLLDDLTAEHTRLGNRMGELLWRYYPSFLSVCPEPCQAFALALWQMAPTPGKARRLSRARVDKLIKAHRIRRIVAEQVLEAFQAPQLTLQAGTAEAALDHIALLIPRIVLVQRQIASVQARIVSLTTRFAESQRHDPPAGAPDGEAGPEPKPGDTEILASIPGVGTRVLAVLISEAQGPLQRRDYAALRALAGVAPVTKRSGKTIKVERRHACHQRLANATYHWARVAAMTNAVLKAKYAALRGRGKTHACALRCIADRLLNTACAMLRTQTLFDPSKLHQKTPC